MDVATVRADHSYAMNVTRERKERSLYDLLSDIGTDYVGGLDLENILPDGRSRDKQNRAEFNGKIEHNYFRPDPDSTSGRRRERRTIHETEHNYGRPCRESFDVETNAEIDERSENDNRCGRRTLSEIFEGCPWSVSCPWTICDGGESCSVQLCRITDSRSSYFSC